MYSVLSFIVRIPFFIDQGFRLLMLILTEVITILGSQENCIKNLPKEMPANSNKFIKYV